MNQRMTQAGCNCMSRGKNGNGYDDDNTGMTEEEVADDKETEDDN